MNDYDRFFAEFVDAVQQGEPDFAAVSSDWASYCPEAWRERFARDLAEIGELIALGVFSEGVVA